jgi:hypothetical protein
VLWDPINAQIEENFRFAATWKSRGRNSQNDQGAARCSARNPGESGISEFEDQVLETEGRCGRQVQCGPLQPEYRVMVETRIATRYRVNKPAKIDHGGDKINCIIRDLSATGAALEISDIARVPANFTLIIPEDRLRLQCRLVWRTEYRIGVAFD